MLVGSFEKNPKEVPRSCFVGVAQFFSTLKPRPNDRNMSTQHIATLLGATCCVRLATVLRRVATCCVLLARVWKWSNWSQQHLTCRNTVVKRIQHVAPNNAAICCVDMLRSFGRGFRGTNSKTHIISCHIFSSRYPNRYSCLSSESFLWKPSWGWTHQAGPKPLFNPPPPPRHRPSPLQEGDTHNVVAF